MMSATGDTLTERDDANQLALMNILEDAQTDKELMGQTQRAMLNILDDAAAEKSLLEDMQKAVMNILDDYAGEIERVETMNAKLKEARDTLEMRVENRTAELKQSNEELESFSYSVSHDLRAPLRAINGYSQMLVSDYAEHLDEDGRQFIETITRNVNKMSALIDDILAFSRLGRQEMRLEMLPMRELFQLCFDELTDGVDTNKISFDLRELKPVLGDRSMITQLVTNLLSNAIKYSAPRPQQIIRVEGASTDEGDVYSVADNGVGFNEKYMDKLFGVFQRLHGEDEFAGTGVGLAIARRVVTHHRGRLWASSQLDVGSVFYFSLGLQEKAYE